MKRKIFSLFLILAVLLPLTAGILAADTPDYLALGDSISTGYGLTDVQSQCFVNLLASQTGCTLTNRSADGNTADGVYEELRHGALDSLLADAELITLTFGGNDLMAALYERIAQAYNTDHPAAPIAPEDVVVILGGTHETVSKNSLLSYAITALQGFSESQEFTAELSAFTASLGNVMRYIRSVNPTAAVVIPTQYNPYRSFQNSYFYKMVYDEIEAGVLLLNAAIKDNASALGYTAADVYTAFAQASDNLCNASASLTLNLDFHPNAAGHTVIKTAIAAAIPSPLTRYTVTFDGNGGDGTPAAVPARSGTTVTLPSGIPVRTGFTFLGWSSDKKAASAQYQPGGAYTVTGDAVLYAVWECDALPGDVNGDGTVNLSDAAYLNCHLAAPQSYPLTPGTGDYSSDGVIDRSDAVELMWDLIG